MVHKSPTKKNTHQIEKIFKGVHGFPGVGEAVYQWNCLTSIFGRLAHALSPSICRGTHNGTLVRPVMLSSALFPCTFDTVTNRAH